MLTIYKASAGSGKTFTLTYNYIKLLLGHKDERGRYTLRKSPGAVHRSILAVTFTNKATDEMKRRIIHELAVLGEVEPGWMGKSPYRNRLMEELHCDGEELKGAAKTSLLHLLFDFNFFQVSTIDSFFQVILRTFAREAELTGNYEVDLENDRAMEAGVKSLFDSLKEERESPENARMIDWLTEFLLNELKEGHGVALFNRRSGAFSQLLDFVRRTDTEEFKRRYDDMMDYLSSPELIEKFRSQLAAAPERHKAMTSKACREALATIESRGYNGGKLKVSATVTKLLENGAINGYDTAKSEGKTLDSVLGDSSSAYNAALKKHLADNPDDRLDLDIARAFSLLKEGRVYRPLWLSLSRQLYTLGMLRAIYRHIDSFRAENNSFLLSDTNSILKEIIGEGDTPFVFERLGVWLNHFLIDEFQDTSRMQWEIMKPLVDQGQSTDSDSLIIGDEKQCIYRFRSSDPTLLQYQVIGEFGEKATVKGNMEEENTNWRSSFHVVTFNNSLFRTLAQKLDLGEVYSNVCQQVAPKHSGHKGYVLARQITTENKEDFTEHALDGMVSEIKRQLRAGYRGNEIAVLVRSRNDGAEVIGRLSGLIGADPDFKGLRVVSDDAMSLASAPSVRLIISVLNYLRSLDEPEATGDGSEAGKRRRLAEIKRMINRYEYRRSRGLAPAEALEQAVNGDDTFDIREDVGDMACFSLPSLVERIISRMFTPEELESENMFLSAFQDTVLDFCSSGNTDLQSFLSWWETKGSSVTVSAPDDENAIRVMTIHKSKGLEFRCVHVPLLSREMISFGDSEWFERAPVPLIDTDVIPPLLSIKPSRSLKRTAFAPQYDRRCREQLLDELNVLYVALTRASDELCITYYNTTRNSECIPVGMLLSGFIPELPQMQRAERVNETDDSETYVFGEPTMAGTGETKRTTALDPAGLFFMPAYSTADRNDLWANTRIDDLPDFSRPRDRGIILHEVLSRVHEADGLSHAVASCVHALILPEAESGEIEEFLADELKRPEIAPWFSGFRKAVTERPLMLPPAETLRPDRVVWTADGHIDIIDYKFGQEKRSHHRQVARYAECFRNMGHSGVRGFIWYVPDHRIIQVK